MSKDELDLDTGEVKDDDKENTNKKSSKLVVVVGLVCLVVALGGGGTWYFMSKSSDASNQTAIIVDAEQDEIVPASYEPFPSDFVVDLKDDKGEKHHMVIAVSIMTRDEKTQNAIKKHKPLLSNGLLELFAMQDYSNMATIDGKKQLRQKSLLEVRKLLGKQSKHNNVEAVLFTKYMME